MSNCNRRHFLQNSALGLGTLAAGPLLGLAGCSDTNRVLEEPETLAVNLFRSLNRPQRTALCFPYDHKLRHMVNNRWLVTGSVLGDILDKRQYAMVTDLFHGLHSSEYRADVLRQVAHDQHGGGLGQTSIAFFGDTDSGPFQFVLAGRHVTRRCGVNETRRTAFGGPVFYGHAGESFIEEPDHPGNLYWYQGLTANRLYQTLDNEQRETALLDTPRVENGPETVRLAGADAGLTGLRVGDMEDNQKVQVYGLLKDVLAPFRDKDALAAMGMVERSGTDRLHLAYFRNGDIGDNGVWDIWQLEGPDMILFFRGSPHIHAWLHIRDAT